MTDQLPDPRGEAVRACGRLAAWAANGFLSGFFGVASQRVGWPTLPSGQVVSGGAHLLVQDGDMASPVAIEARLGWIEAMSKECRAIETGLVDRRHRRVMTGLYAWFACAMAALAVVAFVAIHVGEYQACALMAALWLGYGVLRIPAARRERRLSGAASASFAPGDLLPWIG